MSEQARTHEIFSESPEARMAFVEKLIESVMDEEVDAEVQENEVEDAHREALRQMCGEALSRHYRRARFTLG